MKLKLKLICQWEWFDQNWFSQLRSAISPFSPVLQFCPFCEVFHLWQIVEFISFKWFMKGCAVLWWRRWVRKSNNVMFRVGLCTSRLTSLSLLFISLQKVIMRCCVRVLLIQQLLLVIIVLWFCFILCCVVLFCVTGGQCFGVKTHQRKARLLTD